MTGQCCLVPQTGSLERLQINCSITRFGPHMREQHKCSAELLHCCWCSARGDYWSPTVTFGSECTYLRARAVHSGRVLLTVNIVRSQQRARTVTTGSAAIRSWKRTIVSRRASAVRLL